MGPFLTGFGNHTQLADLMIAATRDIYRPTYAVIQFFSNASAQFAIKSAAILLMRILVNRIAILHSYRI